MPWNCLCPSKKQKKTKQHNNESKGAALCREDRPSRKSLLPKQQNGKVINKNNKKKTTEDNTNTIKLISKNKTDSGDQQIYSDYEKLQNRDNSTVKNNKTELNLNRKLTFNIDNQDKSDLDGKLTLTTCSHENKSKKVVSVEFDAKYEKNMKSTNERHVEEIHSNQLEASNPTENNYGNYDEIPFDPQYSKTHKSILSAESSEFPFIDADARSKSPSHPNSVQEEQFDSFIRSFEPTSDTVPQISVDPFSVERTNTIIRNGDKSNNSNKNFQMKIKGFPLFVDHDFQHCQFLKDRRCQFCHEVIKAFFVVLKCDCCELTCHEWCIENMKDQNGQNVDSDEYQYYPKSKSFPESSTAKNQQCQPFDNLRLHYVTQRILASILPKTKQRHLQLNGDGNYTYEKEIISMLEQKHGKNYRVFDLESCLPIITLERICELCKHINSWLAEDQEKVVVLQDREDRQRLGVAIAAYLEYLNICSSSYSPKSRHQNDDVYVQNTIKRNWLDLDIFSMKKFLEDFVGPLEIPSYKRYLKYFSGLLSGKIRMNASPIYLKRICVESPPAWMKYGNQLASQLPEWMTFIKIYEGLRCIYTSDIHIIPVTTRQFLFEIGNLRLRGDIMIRCYHIIPFEKRIDGGYNEEIRETFFSAQFHTCAVSGREVIFGRTELDLGSDGATFPSDLKVKLHIHDSSCDENDGVFQSPLIRTIAPSEIAKYDSIENLEANPSLHTQGPIDGSLYATILKSPKSPQETYSFSKSSTTSTSQRQSESLGQCLLSPPPQFSNQEQHYQQRQQYQQQQQPVQPIKSSYQDSVEKPKASIYAATGQQSVTEQRDTHSISSTTSSNTKALRLNNSADIRYNTLQSNYPETTSSSSNNKYIVPVNFNSSDTRHITITEHYNSTTDAPSNNNQTVGNREYAHSPLTLSMDSGISSSGVLNRPHQGSSVSPSSFPSQASPQEDRQRELDDILCDMLMTVQDIPDFSKSSVSQTQRPHYPIVRSQSVIPTSGNYALPSQIQSGSQYSTIQRSQSYVVELPAIQKHPAYIQKDNHDIYDTSSTTTTLTPPPSETGRDTPVATYHHHPESIGNYSTLQHHHREKRETIGSPASHHQLIMSLHQQSSVEPLQVRTDVSTVSASEEEEIPYHAREHSQPFSYGNVPANSFRSDSYSEDPAMIKAQSGLSSPSLVRKSLGRSPSPSSSGYRKTAQRIDFEEMLRDRREKVMSEKYSISDRPDLNNYPDAYSRSYGSENQWTNSSTLYRNNGIHAQDSNPKYRQTYEPIRRSNTMDGFHRSNSTDGISGQTWLQMQQQKLRAKKDQQYRDGRRYFEEVVHTEIKNRPLRSRANVQRYDGYASDTAAFTDEVDYRRPLQVQTRHNQNRVPDDLFQTKTITTTTKERPFVAVRRAHDQAKQNIIASPPLSPLTVLNFSPHGHISQVQQTHYQQQHQQQNGLLSMANNNTHNGHARLVREESFSSYRSETDPEMSVTSSPRPETPAFPVTPRTPYGLSSNGNISPALPPKSPTSLRRLCNSTWSLRSQKSSFSTYDRSKDLYTGNQKGHLQEIVNQNETISSFASRRNSNASNANSEPHEVAPHLVKFVRDSSKYWYKPTISREEAVALLRKAEPGTFIVRDSTTYKNAFGLVLRVAHPPPGVELKTSTGDELVRHFLVEPTSRGVRLKGCNNEPVFTSLSALVYQHSITPLALPCRLIIPDQDIKAQDMHSPAQRQLLTLGAACNVMHLFTCDTESLTGEEAIRKAVSQLFWSKPLPMPTEVHFKVAQQGITLTDNTRQKFFRKHYPASSVSYCGLDPERRSWSVQVPGSDVPVNNKAIFAFVARRTANSKDNQCHVFCDLQPNQPALAVVSFINKVLPTEKQVNYNI